MYARVAAFENRDMGRVDELIGTVQERIRSGASMPSASRFLMLVDRDEGLSLGIWFFESEDAIRAAEPVFEQMGDEIPEELRGRRISVDVYEVAIDDVAEGARAARVSTLEGASDAIDTGIAFIKEQILPAAEDLTGWRGIAALVDRSSGRTKTVTFWDGEESLRASEERANELRSEAAEAMKERIVGVDRFEVALHEVLAAAKA